MANGFLNGLLGAWKMEVLPTAPIPDLSGQGNPIVALAGTTWTNVTGIDGNAVDQGGDLGNRMGIAPPHPFNIISSFTINFWVNRNAAEWSEATSDTFHGVWDDGTEKNWYTVWNQGIDAFQIGLSTNGTAEAAAAQCEVPGGGNPAADTWHMVTAGYDQDAGGPFISVNAGVRNNVLGQALSADIFGASTADFGVAQFFFSGQRVCTGAHDEISFWNRALSTDEVDNLFAPTFFADYDLGDDDNDAHARFFYYAKRGGDRR